MKTKSIITQLQDGQYCCVIQSGPYIAVAVEPTREWAIKEAKLDMERQLD